MYQRRTYKPRPETTDPLPGDPSPEEIAAAVERFKARQLWEKRNGSGPLASEATAGIREYNARDCQLDNEWRT